MSTALLLIDLQNDYFPGGAMELCDAELAVERASALLRAFRRRRQPVFHVQHVSRRPGASFFLPQTPGVEIHAAVRPAEGEALIVKHYPSSFRETGLLEALRQARVTDLVIAGMMTHMCVDTTVRAATDLGFHCQLAGDACATRELSFGGQTVQARDVQLAYLAALHGTFATVTTAEALADDAA